MRGNQVIWACSISDGVSYSLDTEISPSHPEYWREGISGQTFSEGYGAITGLWNSQVLAEVVAEALAFNILEKQFKKEGQEGMLDYTSVDAYYHKHFSDFVTIAHKNLVTELSWC